ncbi:DUF3597 domain-containing protein [Janthinobacterium sp. RB2P8]|uniref:DUF3597 domain-containing protein n=1 Tax=Janthinobacterium sp. RB2P8 TaxID=3424191 RepID=UPI003F27598C
MGIFSNIYNKIFHHASDAAPAATPVAATDVPAAAVPAAAAAPAVAVPVVDVEVVLVDLASKNAETLNWRTSIVDLMKLLQLDSSLGSRKELAQELHFTGDTNDSASMNIWLHRQVMIKLAENGGKVPEELKN